MTSQRIKLAGVVAVALVMLQAVTAVLLWQLVDETREDTPAASQQRQQPAPAPPPLPGGGGSGNSARALLDELDATTRRLEAPLRDMQAQLANATRQFDFLPTLPPLLAQIGGNTAGFQRLPFQIDALIAQTRSLSIIPGALALVLGELRRLRGLTASVGRLEGSLGRLEGGLGGVQESVEGVDATADRIGQSFDKAVVVLEQMSRDVARMRECIETPGVCNAQPPVGGAP